MLHSNLKSTLYNWYSNDCSKKFLHCSHRNVPQYIMNFALRWGGEERGEYFFFLDPLHLLMQRSSSLDRKEPSAWDTAAERVVCMHRQWSCSVCPLLGADQTDNEILRKLLRFLERARICPLPFLSQVSTSLPIKPNLWTLLGIKKDDLLKLLIYTSEPKSFSEKLFHKFWMKLRSGKILEKIGYSAVASIKKVQFCHQDNSISMS